jgi:hypothetical protein
MFNDIASEPIDYVEAAWLWMSAGGSNDDAHMREDFRRFPVAELADAGLKAWDNDPPLDRARFVSAFADLKSALEQAGAKPGDVA